jgi:hypothetical protein
MCRPARDRIVELWIPVVFVACVGHARGHTGRVSTYTFRRVALPVSASAAAGPPAPAPRCVLP